MVDVGLRKCDGAVDVFDQRFWDASLAKNALEGHDIALRTLLMAMSSR